MLSRPPLSASKMSKSWVPQRRGAISSSFAARRDRNSGIHAQTLRSFRMKMQPEKKTADPNGFVPWPKILGLLSPHIIPDRFDLRQLKHFQTKISQNRSTCAMNESWVATPFRKIQEPRSSRRIPLKSYPTGHPGNLFWPLSLFHPACTIPIPIPFSIPFQSQFSIPATFTERKTEGTHPTARPSLCQS